MYVNRSEWLSAQEMKNEMASASTTMTAGLSYFYRFWGRLDEIYNGGDLWCVLQAAVLVPMEWRISLVAWKTKTRMSVQAVYRYMCLVWSDTHNISPILTPGEQTGVL